MEPTHYAQSLATIAKAQEELKAEYLAKVSILEGASRSIREQWQSWNDKWRDDEQLTTPAKTTKKMVLMARKKRDREIATFKADVARLKARKRAR